MAWPISGALSTLHLILSPPKTQVPQPPMDSIIGQRIPMGSMHYCKVELLSITSSLGAKTWCGNIPNLVENMCKQEMTLICEVDW